MTSEEFRVIMESMAGRIATLEQAVAGQQSQMQLAANKYLEVNGELNYLKGQVDQIGSKGGKTIDLARRY